MDPRYAVLDDAARLAHEFVDSLATRQVGAQEGLEELRERFARPLTDAGEDPRTVIAELARDADPGLIASGGPRYFGFVIGGSLPVAIAADWLTGAWGQNGGGFVGAPAPSVGGGGGAGGVRGGRGAPGGGRGARRAGAAGGLQRRLRPRRPEGALHVPRRGPPRRASRRGLGRRGAGTPGRPRGARHRGRAGARDGAGGVPHARARRRAP